MRDRTSEFVGTGRMRPRRNGILGISALVFWNLLLWLSVAQLSVRTAAAQGAASGNLDQAQVEKGRQVVGEVCVACHTNILRMLQVHRKSPDQWKDTVFSMIGRGAQIMPGEIDAVTAFLVATAGNDRPAAAQAPGGGRGGGGGRGEQLAPDSDGRAILQRSCQQCHDLATASNKQPSEDWGAVISKMMTYGARLTPADQEKLVAYLNSLAK